MMTSACTMRAVRKYWVAALVLTGTACGVAKRDFTNGSAGGRAGLSSIDDSGGAGHAGKGAGGSGNAAHSGGRPSPKKPAKLARGARTSRDKSRPAVKAAKAAKAASRKGARVRTVPIPAESMAIASPAWAASNVRPVSVAVLRTQPTATALVMTRAMTPSTAGLPVRSVPRTKSATVVSANARAARSLAAAVFHGISSGRQTRLRHGSLS